MLFFCTVFTRYFFNTFKCLQHAAYHSLPGEKHPFTVVLVQLFYFNHSTSPLCLDYFPFCHLKYSFFTLGVHHKQLLAAMGICQSEKGQPLHHHRDP